MTGTGTGAGAAGAADAGQSLLARGLVHFKARQFAQALPLLEAAQALDPKDLSTLLLLGVTYARLDRPERAEPLLREVVARGEPEDQAAARVLLAGIYRDQGASDRARLELDTAARQSQGLRPGVQGLLQGLQPHLISGSLVISPEFDGNVPLAPIAAWRATPSEYSDGDVLFLGALTVRPSKRVGLYFTNALSYRQQFRFQQYNLLINNTTAGYAYYGVRHRIRAALGISPAVLGAHLLFFDYAWRGSYRFNIVGKFGIGLQYDGRYRDYLRPDYAAFTGHTHIVTPELSFSALPDPVTISVGLQGMRDALAERAPIVESDGTVVSDDFRAWALGPALRLRARLHRRVELVLLATLLWRTFDFVSPSGDQRRDLEFTSDLSLNLELTRWLDMFVGAVNNYNHSNEELFNYYKPTVYMGLTGHFAAY